MTNLKGQATVRGIHDKSMQRCAAAPPARIGYESTDLGGRGSLSFKSSRALSRARKARKGQPV